MTSSCFLASVGRRVFHGIRLLVCGLAVWPALALAQQFTVSPVQPAYRAGETIRWTVTVDGGELKELQYRIRLGGLDGASWSTLTLEAGKTTISTVAGNTPGWVLLELKGVGAGGADVSGFGGALISPERIVPASQAPADFDAFWSAKLVELDQVPMHAVVTPGESGRSGIEYALVQMDNIRGTHIEAQLARPAEGGKLPALLILQWAGVYGLEKDWVLGRAAEGWLVLNVNPHDLPIGQPKAYYEDLAKGPLGSYQRIGNDDREASYFLRMYLSCHRAVEYLASRPDWDGRTIVVMGASQGGLQSLFTAAMNSRVTAVLAEVPAGSDQLGPDVGRLASYPTQLEQAWERDLAKVRQTCLYYDIVHFAPKIHCPTLIGVGLIDTVVPPPGVYATFNQIPGAKEIVVLPRADHQNGHEAYTARAEAWLKELKEGRLPPQAGAAP